MPSAIKVSIVPASTLFVMAGISVKDGSRMYMSLDSSVGYNYWHSDIFRAARYDNPMVSCPDYIKNEVRDVVVLELIIGAAVVTPQTIEDMIRAKAQQKIDAIKAELNKELAKLKS